MRRLRNKSLEKTNLLLIILIILQNPFLFGNGCYLFEKKFHVIIANKLPNNRNLLVAHCQSKDTELGYHKLRVDEDFGWRFCDNGWTTLYFCHIWWGNKQISLDVFNRKVREDCNNNIKGQGSQYCYWRAVEDGMEMAVGNLFNLHRWQ